MSKILNNRLTLFVLISCVLSLASACKKTENMDSSTVELLSFGPSGVRHGEEIRFIGYNLDRVTEIEFAGITVSSTDFLEHTAKVIVLVVPDGARNGFVTLKTSEGDIVTKTKLNFTVDVEIVSFPATAKPGDNITIEGVYMDWISQITFGGKVSVEQFASQSHTELVVRVPLEAKTGNLILRVGNETVETETPVTMTLPTISGFDPNPAEPLGELTITGTDLDIVKGVIFAGVNDTITDVTVQSAATELLVTVPEGTLGGKVTLLTFSNERVESTGNLSIIGALPVLDFPIYIDAAMASGVATIYKSSAVTYALNDTEHVRQGTSAIKVNYTKQWDYFAPIFPTSAPLDISGYKKLVFSVYGGPGTEGKQLIVPLGGGTNIGPITIQEGEWTDYSLSTADNATATNVLFQTNTDWEGSVWFDYMGFKNE
ncbi:hypothetical protein G5B30_04145 [Sphingobacterium sp. SGG-5]|uniref:IPT/TIG domain-containing protein n=1 Tax=Sphingobacterium sp. SGG-5 TaxID=2710881 RepID=UPI0013EA2E95|nr:IPT/TIG domain-containing protein [Sphingobacterium sp. SGG-5]NGM61106.1 hypothetical protein [Sphingobacterium sp. SGG-5]